MGDNFGSKYILLMVQIVKLKSNRVDGAICVLGELTSAVGTITDAHAVKAGCRLPGKIIGLWLQGNYREISRLGVCPNGASWWGGGVGCEEVKKKPTVPGRTAILSAGGVQENSTHKGVLIALHEFFRSSKRERWVCIIRSTRGQSLLNWLADAQLLEPFIPPLGGWRSSYIFRSWIYI